MDDNSNMKFIARNRTVYFNYLCILIISINSFIGFALAGGSQSTIPSIPSMSSKLPVFYEFNRSINQGSEISQDVKYKGRPTDKLEIGTESPLLNSWESHSTLTTGLFPIAPKSRKAVFFWMRIDKNSYPQLESGAVLWVSVRYFDRHGLLIHSSGGKKFQVEAEWKLASVLLAPTKADTAFAEVWFVKFQDADLSGGINHSIYLSGLELR